MVRRVVVLALGLTIAVVLTPQSAAANTYCSSWNPSHCFTWSSSTYSSSESYFSGQRLSWFSSYFTSYVNTNYSWWSGSWGSYSGGTGSTWYSGGYHHSSSNDGLSVPEPGALILLLTGMIGLGYVGRQRREDMIEQEKV